MLHPARFNYIDKVFGPHTIDRFANCQNAQLLRYNSRYWDPLSEGVDALAQKNWQYENNYVNPPFCLIPHALQVIKAQKAYATIIAPMWKAQTWFRQLQILTISTPLRIPNSPRVFRAMGPTPEPCRNRKWQIYAWRVFGGKVKKNKGWSDDSANRMQFCLAKSTIGSYNKVISRYADFRKVVGCQFPSNSTAVLADFFSEHRIILTGPTRF